MITKKRKTAHLSDLSQTLIFLQRDKELKRIRTITLTFQNAAQVFEADQ